MNHYNLYQFWVMHDESETRYGGYKRRDSQNFLIPDLVFISRKFHLKFKIGLSDLKKNI